MALPKPNNRALVWNSDKVEFLVGGSELRAKIVGQKKIQKTDNVSHLVTKTKANTVELFVIQRY